MMHSGDECRLSCGSESLSNDCDDATKQCRSTCGLYENNNSATEVLQGLSDALPPQMPLRVRLDRSKKPYVQIINRFKKLGNDLKPQSFSLLVPKASVDAYAEDISQALDKMFEPVTITDGRSAVIQFSLLPASVERIRANGDPEQMLNDASQAIIRAFDDRKT